MAYEKDETVSLFDELNRRLQHLEARVAELENRPENGRAASSSARAVSNRRPDINASPPPTWRGFPPVETSGGFVPVIGKAILALAGAYLLRAVAESGALPKLPVVVLAIFYAGFWMVWAVRKHAKDEFASVTFAITSILILAPLLWESTVRFEVLAPIFSGVVLTNFVILTLALTWKHELYAIPWITVLTVVFTTLGLVIATHELIPLTATLLLIALVVEIAACFGHHLTLRVVPAFSLNITVLLMVDLLMSADGPPPGYHSAPDAALTVLCLGPLLIYGMSIAIRTVWLRKKITVFEMAQAVFAFVISVFASIRSSHGSIVPVLSGFFLVLAALCYWSAFLRFDDEECTRNRITFATWAAALLLAGSILLFPPNVKVAFLCGASLGTVYTYKRTGKITFALHTTLFLAAAALVSPLTEYTTSALAGTVPSFPQWSIWLVTISASICYYAESHGPKVTGYRRAIWFLPAFIISFTLAAFTIAASMRLGASFWNGSASQLSVVRTLVNCALALGLGYLRKHWQRVELGWIAFSALVFGSIKLLVEDMRYGNANSLVFSFLFYGIVLIFLPRLMSDDRTKLSSAPNISSGQSELRFGIGADQRAGR